MSWIEHLQTLFAYNQWANRRVLGACDGLSEDDLRRDFGTSRGSVATTLYHVVGVEAGWFSRWSEMEMIMVHPPGQGTAMADLREGFEKVDAAMIEFADARSDEDIGKIVQFPGSQGKTYWAPVWAIMAHGMNHSTQHRAEAGVMLESLGSAAGDIDYLYFAEDAGFAFQPVSE